MVIRKSWPQVYVFEPKRGGKYWMVNARSKRWGMNSRPTFNSEAEALDRARAIAKQIEECGAQTNIPKEKLVCATAYEKLTDQLEKRHKEIKQDNKRRNQFRQTDVQDREKRSGIVRSVQM